MKALPWIIVAILVLIVLYSFTKPKVTTPNTSQLNQANQGGFNAGLALANLIGSTSCGKNGNPPCTITDLTNAGWSPSQISDAQAGSQQVQATWLCLNTGYGC